MKGTRLELPDSEITKFNKLLANKAKEINKEAQVGLNKVGSQILADSQQNLKDSGSYASGKLIGSGFVEARADGTIDVIYKANYAYWVEFGRKAGTPPPYKPILEWIKKRQLTDVFNIKTQKRASRGAAKDYVNKRGKQVKQSDFYKRAISMAIAIAKSVGKNGTKAKPFLFPAFRKSEDDMIRTIKQAIDKVV